MNKKRPELNKVDLKSTMQDIVAGKPNVYITMSEGQWDTFLETAYFKCDVVLLELNELEIPIAAYRLKEPNEEK